ncbi:MAG: hypothetical protein IJN29_10415, partial [Akkermansia sp.]|nr:hypothetical protein [Akkermansia sp.]
MKLHLPKSLRRAVLSCLALAGSLSTTIGTGFIAGGAVTIAFVTQEVGAEVPTPTVVVDGVMDPNHSDYGKLADENQVIALKSPNGWFDSSTIKADIILYQWSINGANNNGNYIFEGDLYTPEDLEAYIPASRAEDKGNLHFFQTEDRTATIIFRGSMTEFAGDITVHYTSGKVRLANNTGTGNVTMAGTLEINGGQIGEGATQTLKNATITAGTLLLNSPRSTVFTGVVNADRTTLDGTGSLTFGHSASSLGVVTVNKNATIVAGTYTMSGLTATAGSLANGGALILSGSIKLGSAINNTGSIAFAADSVIDLSAFADNEGTYSIVSGGTVDMSALTADNITGVSTAGKNWSFNNDGTISYVQFADDLVHKGGSLSLSDGVSVGDGTFNNNDMLTFAESDAVVSLAGNVSASKVTINEGVEVSLTGGDYTMSSSEVDLNGTLVLKDLKFTTSALEVGAQGKLVLDAGDNTTATIDSLPNADNNKCLAPIEIRSGSLRFMSTTHTFGNITVKDGAGLLVDGSSTVGAVTIEGDGGWSYGGSTIDAALYTTSGAGLKGALILSGDATVGAAEGKTLTLKGNITGDYVLTKIGAGSLKLSGGAACKEIVVEAGNLYWADDQNSEVPMGCEKITLNSGTYFEIAHYASVNTGTDIVLKGARIKAEDQAPSGLEGSHDFGKLTVLAESTIEYNWNGALHFSGLTGSSVLNVKGGQEAGKTWFKTVTDYNGSVKTSNMGNHELVIGAVNQAEGKVMTVDGAVTLQDFCKTGSGAFTVTGVASLKGNVGMNYEGSLTLSGGVSIAEGTLLSYTGKGGLIGLNTISGSVIIDVVDVDATTLAGGFDLGIASSVDTALISVLGLNTGEYTLDTSGSTIKLSTNTKSHTEWDFNWGKQLVLNAPAVKEYDVAQDAGVVSLVGTNVDSNKIVAATLKGGGDGAVVLGGASETNRIGNSWIRGESGTYKAIVGGNYANNYGSGGTIAHFVGDSHIVVDGATVGNIIGGNYKDGQAASFTGDSYISVKSGNVTAGIVGAGTNAHNSTNTFNGDTNVFVYVPLTTNNQRNLDAYGPGDAVIGGGTKTANTQGTNTVNGNTNVTIDLSDYAGTATQFVKKVIGGNFNWSGDLQSNINGNTNVTIIGKNGVAFKDAIVGGHQNRASTNKVTGTTTVNISGGSTFEGDVIGGTKLTGGATAITGSSVVNISGGTFQNVYGATFLDSGYAALEHGSSTVTISGSGTIVNGNLVGGMLVGGNDATGLIKSTIGDISVTLNGGTLQNVYGGSNVWRNNGDVTVHQGNIKLTINGATVQGDIYAAGAQNNATKLTTESTEVTIHSGVALTSGKTISGGYGGNGTGSTITGTRTLAFTGTQNRSGVTFKDFDVIDVAANSTATIGALETTAAVTKKGTGTLALTGAYTLSGGLTVTEGTLASAAVGTSLGGALTLADGVGLDLTAGSIALSGALTLGENMVLQVQNFSETETEKLLLSGITDADFEAVTADTYFERINNEHSLADYKVSLKDGNLILSKVKPLEWDVEDTTWTDDGEFGQGIFENAKTPNVIFGAATDTEVVTVDGSVTAGSVVISSGAEYEFNSINGGVISASKGVVVEEDASVALAGNVLAEDVEIVLYEGSTLKWGTTEAGENTTDYSGRLTVHGGVTLDAGSNTVTLSDDIEGLAADSTITLKGNFVLHDDTVLKGTVSIAEGGTVELMGAAVADGDNYNQNFTGKGGLNVTDGLTIHLTGSNDYTGDTVLGEGCALHVDAVNAYSSASKMTGSGNLLLNAAGEYDWNMSSDMTGTVTIANGATVKVTGGTGVQFDGVGSMLVTGGTAEPPISWNSKGKTYTGTTTLAANTYVTTAGALTGVVNSKVVLGEGSQLSITGGLDSWTSGHTVSGTGTLVLDVDADKTDDDNTTATGAITKLLAGGANLSKLVIVSGTTLYQDLSSSEVNIYKAAREIVVSQGAVLDIAGDYSNNRNADNTITLDGGELRFHGQSWMSSAINVTENSRIIIDEVPDGQEEIAVKFVGGTVIGKDSVKLGIGNADIGRITFEKAITAFDEFAIAAATVSLSGAVSNVNTFTIGATSATVTGTLTDITTLAVNSGTTVLQNGVLKDGVLDVDAVKVAGQLTLEFTNNGTQKLTGTTTLLDGAKLYMQSGNVTLSSLAVGNGTDAATVTLEGGNDEDTTLSAVSGKGTIKLTRQDSDGRSNVSNVVLNAANTFDGTWEIAGYVNAKIAHTDAMAGDTVSLTNKKASLVLNVDGAKVAGLTGSLGTVVGSGKTLSISNDETTGVEYSGAIGDGVTICVSEGYQKITGIGKTGNFTIATARVEPSDDELGGGALAIADDEETPVLVLDMEGYAHSQSSEENPNVGATNILVGNQGCIKNLTLAENMVLTTRTDDELIDGMGLVTGRIASDLTLAGGVVKLHMGEALSGGLDLDENGTTIHQAAPRVQYDLAGGKMSFVDGKVTDLKFLSEAATGKVLRAYYQLFTNVSEVVGIDVWADHATDSNLKVSAKLTEKFKTNFSVNGRTTYEIVREDGVGELYNIGLLVDGNAADLTWKGGDGTWNSTNKLVAGSKNWNNSDLETDDKTDGFWDDDNAHFIGDTNATIIIEDNIQDDEVEGVRIGSMTITGSADYIFQGAAITSGEGLGNVLIGTTDQNGAYNGTVTFENKNTWKGSTYINDGHVVAKNAGSLSDTFVHLKGEDSTLTLEGVSLSAQVNMEGGVLIGTGESAADVDMSTIDTKMSLNATANSTLTVTPTEAGIAGDVTVNDYNDYSDSMIGKVVFTDADLKVGSTLTIGRGSADVAGAMTNAGTVTVNGGGTLTAQSGLTNSGTVKVKGGALSSTGETINNGTMEVTDGEVTLAELTNAKSTEEGAGEAKLTISGGEVTITGTLTNSDIVEVTGGSLTAGSVENSGSLAINGDATVTVGAKGATGTSLTNTGGTITIGTTTGEGATTGSLTVNGNLEHSGDGADIVVNAESSMEVTGNLKGEGMTLDFGGDVTVGGDLTLSELNIGKTAEVKAGGHVAVGNLQVAEGGLLHATDDDTENTVEIGTLSGKGTVKVDSGTLHIGELKGFTGALAGDGTLSTGNEEFLLEAQQNTATTDIIGGSVRVASAANGSMVGDVTTNEIIIDELISDNASLSMGNIIRKDGAVVSLTLSEINDETTGAGYVSDMLSGMDAEGVDEIAYHLLNIREGASQDIFSLNLDEEREQQILQAGKIAELWDGTSTAVATFNLRNSGSNVYLKVRGQGDEESVWNLDGAHDKTEAGLVVLKDGKLVSNDILDNVRKVVVTGEQELDLTVDDISEVTLNGLTAADKEAKLSITGAIYGSDQAVVNTAEDGFEGTLVLSKLNAQVQGTVANLVVGEETSVSLDVTDTAVKVAGESIVLSGTMSDGSLGFGVDSANLGEQVIGGDVQMQGSTIEVEQTDSATTLDVTSGRTVIADLGGTNGEAEVTLTGKGFEKYFTNARLEGGKVVADRNTEYAESMIAVESENGAAGAELLSDALVTGNPQANAKDGILADLMDVVDSGRMTDADAAAVAGSSIATLGMALSGDVERQLRAIRNRTTSMGVNECVVNEGMPYFNAWV